MRRFRLLFVAIAILVVVPVGLLLRRAVESVELEARTRHQAVAERIFDEMERALSEMLAREEQRPFGQYSYEYTPPGPEAGALLRSPLAEGPGAAFIVGYFQIDPDGTLQTPLRPAGSADWQPSPEARAAISALDQTVAPYFRDAAGAGLARARMAPERQAPGTTVGVSDDKARRETTAQNLQDLAEAPAYDALRALNKGAEQRAARQTKTELAYAPAAAAAPKAARQGRFADERDAPLGRGDMAKAKEAVEPARLEIAPMVGRVIDAHHMLLYRTVVREAQAYRQGLLLDLDALANWLRGEGLGSDDLAAYATVVFGNRLASMPSVEPAAFVYQHRFAEPFADLSARLALRALPGAGSAGYVYALCAVVVIAGGLGLLALYRMVSVTVAYAERRSNFVAAVSHELKTPLTTIRMYGEMLRDGIVPSAAKRAEYYRHITAESERLSRLINNVLEFSHLEKGTRQMSLQEGALGPVVIEAAERLGRHAEREGFVLDVAVDTPLPAVRFEPDAVVQMLFNLVDNAVKYARDGDPKRVRLACRLVGTDVHVVVRDHGPGVSPRHLGKLFDLYGGQSELTRRNQGSGLGLALVRSLATQMGARTAARNIPEGGFEVEVVFPALKS